MAVSLRVGRGTQLRAGTLNPPSCVELVASFIAGTGIKLSCRFDFMHIP